MKAPSRPESYEGFLVDNDYVLLAAAQREDRLLR